MIYWKEYNGHDVNLIASKKKNRQYNLYFRY